MNNTFIAIDLELEQPNTNEQTPDSEIEEEKIIQVGICVFNLNKQDIEILHSETMMIHYPGKLSQFIKKLTSITDEDVNNSSNSPYNALLRIVELRKIYNASRQIVEWGSGDMSCLLQKSGVSVKNSIEKLGFARGNINVKNIYQCYAFANNKKTSGGLSKSMGRMGIQFVGTKYNGKNRGVHWAEADAKNTARIFNSLINNMRKE